MRFIAIAAALVSVATASAVPTVLDARDVMYPPTQEDCSGTARYIGVHDTTLIYRPACASVGRACLKENGMSIWSHAACVASATCQGTQSAIILNQCQNPNVLPASSIPSWSAAIYGVIVGDCAASGCPIMQQNYVDFVFSQMSAANVTGTEWPKCVFFSPLDIGRPILILHVTSVDDVAQWWDPITAWTATGDSVPYSNFNDWLHWSNS
ncbi:hypothetical protein DFH06DRAFT_1181280 [Mycena polygramma]|nr:hypothetical protein DFH06DRAFT_1181280 [Mycena polygramma]